MGLITSMENVQKKKKIRLSAILMLSGIVSQGSPLNFMLSHLVSSFYEVQYLYFILPNTLSTYYVTQNAIQYWNLNLGIQTKVMDSLIREIGLNFRKQIESKKRDFKKMSIRKVFQLIF